MPRSYLNRNDLLQMAEKIAYYVLKKNAAEVYKMIDEDDDRIKGTMAEHCLISIRCLISEEDKENAH